MDLNKTIRTLAYLTRPVSRIPRKCYRVKIASFATTTLNRSVDHMIVNTHFLHHPFLWLFVSETLFLQEARKNVYRYGYYIDLPAPYSEDSFSIVLKVIMIYFLIEINNNASSNI